MKVAKSILVISDFHAPYNHPDAANFLRACKAKFKPDTVVCIGDEADFHALSYHESNPDLPSAAEELRLAIKALQPLYAMFPQCTVIESNHGSMVLRKSMTAGIPVKAQATYNSILSAPTGWKWVFDAIVQTELGPVYFCHGKAAAPGKLARAYGMTCVQGHFHEKAQVTCISTPERLFFDVHTGCLAEDKSLALGYNKINTYRPIVSIAVILNGIPQIVPMVLRKGGRWTGKL